MNLPNVYGTKAVFFSIEIRLTYRNKEPKDNSSVIVNVNVTPSASKGNMKVIGKVDA